MSEEPQEIFLCRPGPLAAIEAAEDELRRELGEMGDPEAFARKHDMELWEVQRLCWYEDHTWDSGICSRCHAKWEDWN